MHAAQVQKLIVHADTDVLENTAVGALTALDLPLSRFVALRSSCIAAVIAAPAVSSFSASH